MACGSAACLCWLSIFIVLSNIHLSFSGSFIIDYENDVFLKDGEPFRYISGSFHYFRVPQFYWKDRMMKMKSAGLNTLQTIVQCAKVGTFLGTVLLSAFLVESKTRGTRKKKSLRSFVIDYNQNVFLKDGTPFRFISGDMHYFRVPSCHWNDKLRKMKQAGLNAVATYVAWNMHEPVEGNYSFTGNNDIVSFIELAQSLGLLVIVRAGPFIDAERDLGGLPAWLLKNYTTAKFRSSSDENYLNAVDRWMSVLLPKLKPNLYANGGPIIAVQVENEYGSYFTCDHKYMYHLQNLFEQYLGKDVILFTTDGPVEGMLECGSLPTLYTTVDFGIGDDPSVHFSTMRKFQPNGPLVNSEFYPGWLDHWGEAHQERNPAQVAHYLDLILAMNASVNMYMFEGGTSFGFMNGANGDLDSQKYQPQPTSYDYDAPLTEAGDTTEKYFLIMETIAKYAKIPPGPVPPPTKKYAYGKVTMTKMISLLDALPLLSPNGPMSFHQTLSMEQVGQNYGFILYRTQTPSSMVESMATISIPGLRDRGIVFVNKVRQAVLIRIGGKTSATIKIGANMTLDILVENMGRINYGPHLQDPKGILGDVTINKEVLRNWLMYPLELDQIVGKKHPLRVLGVSEDDDRDDCSGEGQDSDDIQIPTFFMGDIPPSPDGVPRDTFLQLPGWAKGQAFINGFNLGRYWPIVGPQITLYVPASVLQSGQMSSKLIILELDNAPCGTPQNCYVDFKDVPIINGPVSPLKRNRPSEHDMSSFDDWTSKLIDFLPRYVRRPNQAIDLLV